jgi:phosphate transport system protein
MSDHTVKSYDAELTELTRKITEMGGIAEAMLSNAIEALVKGDPVLAQRVVVTDQRLDTMQRVIEDKAIITIGKRQPMAVDLRSVVSTIRVAADLERIGDLSKNIGKRVVAMDGNFPPQKIMGGVMHMGDLALERLKAVLDAYSDNNNTGAIEVWEHDGEIDSLYNSLFRELLTYMMEDPRNIGFCTHLLFCAKNIERIGDHATNIAETVHFVVTGQTLSLDRPKGHGEMYEPLSIADASL